MIKPEDYFTRYYEHRANECTPLHSWKKTEMDFHRLYGMRRFRNYASFKNALSKFRRGGKITEIKLFVTEKFEL